MSERAVRILRKIAEISLFLAAAASLALFLVRIYYAISFFTPYMQVTTGYEWESIFTVWRMSQHLPLYTDPHRFPFAYTCYNWAYYYFYGWITKACLSLFHLDAIWIPTIGRLISLVFTLIAGGIFYLATRDFVEQGMLARGPVAWAWMLIASCGPLVGFWAITVRSDIGALAFEAAGLYVVLSYLKKGDNRLIVWAALLFYAAWAFKQSSVTMLTGSVLALALLKRWRAFLTLSGIWWALVIITLIVGGPAYRESLLFSQVHLPLQVSFGLKNLLRAEGKNPFFLPCLFVATCFFVRRFPHRISKPHELVLVFVVSFSFFFALVTAAKAGASDNYYIPASWAVMLGFAMMWQDMRSCWLPAGMAVCSCLLVAAIALTPTGRTFYYNYRDSDYVYRALAQKLSRLPGPAFLTDRYANLPWVQSFSPHFIVGFPYYYDRAAGVPFEDGGWEGLVSRGYFATVVIDNSYRPSPSLLKNYDMVDDYSNGYSDYRFYCRSDLVHRKF